MSRLIAISLVFAAVACTQQSDFEPDDLANAESKADGTWWEKVFTCDSGAAVLDVNAAERRDLQFVIRDRGIIGYLANNVRGSTQGIVSPSGEIIVRGHQNNGIWSQGDFHSMDGGVPYVDVNVRRESSGIKAVFYQLINWSRCADGREPSPST